MRKKFRHETTVSLALAFLACFNTARAPREKNFPAFSNHRFILVKLKCPHRPVD